MVIAIHTSDSTNTLVSLDNHHDARSKEASLLLNSSSCQGSCRRSSLGELRKTSLLLPVEDLPGLDNSSHSSLDDDSSDSDSYGYCCSCEHDEPPQEQHCLYLPTSSSSTSVDEVLNQVPAIRDSRDELVSLDHHVFHQASPEEVLYVLQGEVAHATASQCEFLVSDRATTCHILALRSTTADASAKEAMTSLTHLDGDQYEACVREMIQEHKRYHHGGASSSRIEMDITILGGFRDDEGHSQKISNWLLHLLADIADEEAAASATSSSLLQMRLKTCAISSMNDNGFACPLGRGLAIHLATGHTFLAKADRSVVGPHMPLRNARLWSAGAGAIHHHPKLSLIHTTTSNDLIIAPFAFQAIPGMERLLALPDDILLEYTSTSPTVEEGDFCHSIRTTLHFLREVPCARIFGRSCDQPLRFARRSNNTSNQWTLWKASA